MDNIKLSMALLKCNLNVSSQFLSGVYNKQTLWQI